jgi:hypothetical protein
MHDVEAKWRSHRIVLLGMVLAGSLNREPAMRLSGSLARSLTNHSEIDAKPSQREPLPDRMDFVPQQDMQRFTSKTLSAWLRPRRAFGMQFVSQGPNMSGAANPKQPYLRVSQLTGTV